MFVSVSIVIVVFLLLNMAFICNAFDVHMCLIWFFLIESAVVNVGILTEFNVFFTYFISFFLNKNYNLLTECPDLLQI